MQLHGMGFALYEGEVSEGNTAWTIGDNHPYSEGCKEGKQHMPAELRMNTALQAIKNLKQIAREEFSLPGTSICDSYGGLEALRLVAKHLGPRTVFVNAAGCFTLLATLPCNPFTWSKAVETTDPEQW
jgi:hypothetical protein